MNEERVFGLNFFYPILRISKSLTDPDRESLKEFDG